MLLPTELLRKTHSPRPICFGFDEVWSFPSEVIEGKPDSVAIVGPVRIDQAKLDKLGEWMGRCSCSLELGDGEGLNFIVKAHGVVKYLLGHSLEQPRPAMTPYETESG